MTRTHEIYFNDLNDEARAEYLKFQQVQDESELNHEIAPLAILEVEDEEDEDDEPPMTSEHAHHAATGE